MPFLWFSTFLKLVFMYTLNTMPRHVKFSCYWCLSSCVIFAFLVDLTKETGTTSVFHFSNKVTKYKIVNGFCAKLSVTRQHHTGTISRCLFTLEWLKGQCYGLTTKQEIFLRWSGSWTGLKAPLKHIQNAWEISLKTTLKVTSKSVSLWHIKC